MIVENRSAFDDRLEAIENQTLINKVREEISTGALRSVRPTTVWAGMGSGRKCAACGRPIQAAATQIELESVNGRLAGPLHRECFEIWREASAKL
jgi:hypothetical protein